MKHRIPTFEEQERWENAAKCGHCIFSRHADTGDMGEWFTCHRHAPKPIRKDRNSGDDDTQSFWPIVLEGDFCGEFQPAAIHALGGEDDKYFGSVS
jgi:hypothetical protein